MNITIRAKNRIIYNIDFLWTHANRIIYVKAHIEKRYCQI